VISGTPTTAGTSNFTVQVTDAVAATASKALSITINPAPVITTTSLPAGQVTVAYSQPILYTGGVSPYTWSIFSGNLPDGLTLNSGTGQITGTPTVAGTFSFVIQVTDALAGYDQQILSINIAPAPLTITTTSLPNGKKNKAYGVAGGTPNTPQFITATGGTEPYTWSITPWAPLPAWLSINPSTGQITGTPPNTSNQPPYNFTVRVTDSAANTANKPLTITVNN
jgi:hypothetical protein